MKKILLCLSMVLAGLTACEDPNEGEMFVTPTDLESEMSVINVLERDGNYTLWLQLLKHANYYNALKDASAEATVFCPTDEAIKAFLSDREYASVEDIPVDYARSVVQTHIIPYQSVTETMLNDYAEKSSYIPTQNLFESYLTLAFGYTVTDVDDAQRTDDIYVADSIFINNQARLDKFTAVTCANGVIFTMGTVITPLAETIIERMELEDDYTIFSEAIREAQFDSIASKVRDTTYVVGGGYVVNNYNYTCFAVPDDVYRQNGITDVSSLKSWLVSHSDGEETNGDQALTHYLQYHFLLREHSTDELFDFLSEGQTLIFETKLDGQAIITNDIDGQKTINKDIHILRSNIAARNGNIQKVDDVMPVYHPDPVTVRWDFLNSPDIIAFVNAWGAANGNGMVFSNPLANAERKIDLSDNRRNGDYGTLTSFTYKNTDSRASVNQYPVVGFIKEQYAAANNQTTPRYATYMNNYMMLNLGYAGWIQFTTPSIIAGRYKVVLHYCADVSLQSYFASGSLTKFELDDRTANLYVYKGLSDIINARQRVLYGSVDMTLFESIEFSESGNHTFRATMMDINAKTSSTYHQMYDYLEFIPLD